MKELPFFNFGYHRYHHLMKPWVKRCPIQMIAGIQYKEVVVEPHWDDLSGALNANFVVMGAFLLYNPFILHIINWR